MQIEAILHRIRLDDKKQEANLEYLNKLIEQFILSVPYENLDFKLKRGFSANILKIYEKIIEKKRGGVCYETNTLFSYLIKSLGFKVQLIFAQISDSKNIASNYPHLALIVNIEGNDYLVDVGMGKGPRSAIMCDNEEHIVISESNEYKIRSAGKEYALLQKDSKNNSWNSVYTFTKEIRRVADFSYIFTEKEYEIYGKNAPFLITKALINGRVTILDDVVTIKENDNVRSWDITNENRAEVLRDYFQIQIG